MKNSLNVMMYFVKENIKNKFSTRLRVKSTHKNY